MSRIPLAPRYGVGLSLDRPVAYLKPALDLGPLPERKPTVLTSEQRAVIVRYMQAHHTSAIVAWWTETDNLSQERQRKLRRLITRVKHAMKQVRRDSLIGVIFQKRVIKQLCRKRQFNRKHRLKKRARRNGKR